MQASGTERLREVAGRHAGFRNVVAHAYEQIDMARVFRAATEGPADLLAFFAALSAALPR